ncbi:MAG: hypothetical protein K9H48_07795 [Melioribacteraceae bacterium]|nr:hypothetical protein [Melioribacteraceae bacterium]
MRLSNLLRTYLNHDYYYRKNPVPWTGKWSNKRIFRKIRTTQERRWNEDHKKIVKIRGRRKNLPDSWEDIKFETQRCWKKQRKTQYK